MQNKIAIVTAIYNPTKDQLNNYIKSLESFSGLNHKRYAAIKSSTKGIKFLVKKLKKYNIQIKIFDDNGTDDALNKLMPYVKENFIWMLHCGDLLELSDEARLTLRKKRHDENTIYFGTTIFCEGSSTKKSSRFKLNIFYKYKIPILNLISCLIPKKLLLKSGGFKQNYNVATDYDLILRLYQNKPTLKFLRGVDLYFFENGNSFNNRMKGIVEMYFISASFFPKLKFRNLFYFVYLLRRGFSPFLFFRLVKNKNNFIFEYLLKEGHQPYSDKRINSFDATYLKTLKHHYLKSFNELDFITAKYPFHTNFMELGSHLAVNSLYANSKGLSATSSDLYKLSRDSNYRAWLNNNNIRYLAIDLSKDISSKNKFDIIFFHETLEHIPYNPVRVLRNVNNMLNKNGILNITVPNLFSLKNIFKFLCLRHPYIIPSELLAIGTQSEKTGTHWIEYDKKMLIQFLISSGYRIESHQKMILNYGNNSSYFIKKIVYQFFPFIYDQHRIIASKS